MLALVMTLTLGFQAAKAAPDIAAKTPEEAFRTFVAAMITKDEKTVRALALPSDEIDWLLKGQGVPAGQVEAIKAQIAKMPIKALKPGDTYTLPGNRKMTVKPEEVAEDRVVLLPEGSPLPTRCQKVDGRWRVDAGPMIAGRKAADAARKKAEQSKK
ncbi:MAG: hypothetical protein JWN86_4029 [Planctomycetota bacterium]|nr:hypothetical protein [Planctomycetota bacterium]